MANHVYFTITSSDDFNFLGNSPLIETEQRTVANWDGEGTTETTFIKELEEQPFMASIEPKYTDESSYDWYTSNVGAKWCALEEVDEYSLYGYSAWGEPAEMFEHLARAVADKYQSDVSLTMTYEDEFRNFFGHDTITVSDAEVDYDQCQIDGDQLTAKIEERAGCEIDDDFWDKMHTDADGEEFDGQEYADDLVYEFFQTGEWYD